MTAQTPLAIMEEVAPINWQTFLVNVQTAGQEKLVMIALNLHAAKTKTALLTVDL